MKSNKKHLIEESISSSVIHQGKSFSFRSDEIRLPDGRTAKRDYVDYPEAVVILPITEDNKIIFVEQYRYPIRKTLIELPAGKIDDPQEPKESAAHRELVEETGYQAGEMKYIFSFYPAVGYSREMIHVFVAKYLDEVGQNPDEDEFIEPVLMGFDEALDQIRYGRIDDSKTVLSILYYERFVKENE